MAADPFIREDNSSGNPIAITPADADLDQPLRGFMIGGAGSVVVRNMQGADVTLPAPAVGVVHSIRCKRIGAATTATGVVGLV